jgi:hypothetical protein
MFKKIDIKCDTSELLLEGVIHNFPTLLQHLLIHRGEGIGREPKTNRKKNNQGLFIGLLLFPKMLAFAAMPQCWSSENRISAETVNSNSPYASTILNMRK